MSGIYNEICKDNKILFCMFGELGWSIMRFSGVIKFLKKQYPTKHIVVAERLNRYDLYHDSIDEFVPLMIPQCYDHNQNCYRLDGLPEEEKHKIILNLKKRFPTHTIFDPTHYNCNKTIFPWTCMDFNFTPHKDNNSLIQDILNVVPPDRSIIVIPSRHRTDIPHRNWGINNWKQLFRLIHNTGKYFTMIAGVSPTIVRPPSHYDDFICLEDYINNYEHTSHIGITMEALRSAELTIGSQSAVSLLSSLLGTPILCWGGDRERHMIDDNPMNSYVEFIDDPSYNISPELILEGKVSQRRNRTHINNGINPNLNSTMNIPKVQTISKRKKIRKLMPSRPKSFETNKRKKQPLVKEQVVQLNDSYNKNKNLDDKIKIGIVGVFSVPYSSNIKISNAFKKHEYIESVIEFDYRQAQSNNFLTFHRDIINVAKKIDVMFLCKGSGIPVQTVHEISKYCLIYLWFMDPYSTLKYHRDVFQFGKVCDWRSCTGYEIAKKWETSIRLPVEFVLDGGSPETYYTMNNVKKKYDVTFIGVKDKERQIIYESLQRLRFINVKFHGPKFTHFCEQPEFRRICNESKICLNISRGNYEGYSSLRLWSLLGCGSMVLTKFIPNMTRHMGLVEGKNISSFKSMAELAKKIKYYLHNDEARIQIGETGQEFVNENQSWDNVIENVMNIIRFQPPKRSVIK